MSHGKAVAVGSPRELIAEHAGPEALEVYGSPAAARRGRGARRRSAAGAPGAPAPRSRSCTPTATTDDLDGERRVTNLEDVFVLLTGEEISLMAATTHAASGASGRLERAALQGVMVREIVNYSSFWRSSTFSSTVDPTIYLLAFGFGFGSLVSKVAGYDYIDFVGTGIVATTVLFSRRLPGDVLDVRQVPVPAHLRRDPRRAGRHRGARDRRGAVDRARAPASTAACRCSSRSVFGLRPQRRACCSCRSIAALAGFGWACVRDLHRRQGEVDRELLLLAERAADADVPGRRDVLPARPAAAVGAGRSATSTRCSTACSSSATRSSASQGWADVGHLGVPGRLRAGLLAAGDPLHGEAADPLGVKRRRGLLGRPVVLCPARMTSLKLRKRKIEEDRHEAERRG